MSMPKGTKINRGYATTKDGLDYRRISEKLSCDGYKMNHATARNVFIGAMEKIAEELAPLIFDDKVNIGVMASHPMFQSGVADLIQDHDDLEKNAIDI